MNYKGRFVFDERPAKKKELNRLLSLNEFYNPHTKKILEHIRRSVKHEIKNIIDIGAGTGHTTILLKEFFPNANITYFDFSRDLLEYFRGLLKISQHEVKIEHGDILNHSFTEKYDLIFSRFALKHIFNPEHAIKVMCENLNNKGTICLIDKDIYANIWFPKFPLYKTKFMTALNKYNESENRGGDSAIGRKIRYYLSNNNIEIEHEELLTFNLNNNSSKQMLCYKEIFVEVYRNLVPELVATGLLTENQANKDIKKLIAFLNNNKNTAIIFDFVVWGQKNE
jgi:SAM-dependent methyltransferase